MSNGDRNSFLYLWPCLIIVALFLPSVAKGQWKGPLVPWEAQGLQLLPIDEHGPIFPAFFESGPPKGLLPRIPPAHDHAALGVFCKLDVEFERHLRLPLRLRLDDARRVEAWEGKGAWKLVY